MVLTSSDKTCIHFFKITDAMTEEIVCGNYGIVLLEKAVDLGRENIGQAMDEYSSNSRTGQKTSLKMADRGLFTTIQAQNRDSTGRTLSTDNKRSFYRLRMWESHEYYKNSTTMIINSVDDSESQVILYAIVILTIFGGIIFGLVIYRRRK